MKFRPLSEVLSERVREVRAGLAGAARGEILLTHVPTGMPPLDRAFGGLERGVQTLVIGHTGDGKTAFLGALARGAAKAGLGTLLVTLEDPTRRVADRYLGQATGLAAAALGRAGSPGAPPLPGDALERLDATVHEAAPWASHIAHHSGMVVPEQVLGAVRNAAAKGVYGAPLGAVVVDYAQGFSASEESMERLCAEMAQALNLAAGETDAAVILGSQTTRDVIRRGRGRWEQSGGEDETGFRPGRGDAKWSSRLEEYSKAVWTIFRPGRWRRELGDHGAKDDKMEVNVVKQNYGPEGQVVLHWDGPTAGVS